MHLSINSLTDCCSGELDKLKLPLTKWQSIFKWHKTILNNLQTFFFVSSLKDQPLVMFYFKDQPSGELGFEWV
jgi:hypothetical protein